MGERIPLVVELKAPGIFASSAVFDLPKIPGVLLIPPQESPVLGSEMVGDVSWTTQQYEISLIGRHAGEVEIPPIGIRFESRASPLAPESTPQKIRTNALKLVLKMPPGAEQLPAIVSSRDLKVTETWKPSDGKLKAGDALTRTIDYVSSDLPGMAFPPFAAAPLDGVSIYRKDPLVLDHAERGTLHGERREIVSYVFQHAGKFVLPPSKFTWWNIAEGKLRTEEFAGRTVEVARNPAMESAARRHFRLTRQMKERLAWGALGLAAAWVVGRFWWRRRKAIRDYFRPVSLAPLNPTQSGVER